MTTAVALPPGIVLRTPVASDAKALRPLVEEAVGGVERHGPIKLRAIVRSVTVAGAADDRAQFSIRQRSTGTVRTSAALLSARVAACERTGRALGVSYTVPPMDWIKEAVSRRARTSAVVMERAAGLAVRLAEVNLVGVHRAHRRRGIARALLADCAHRYREAGYGALFAITNGSHDDSRLRRFYASCGYTLGERGVQWLVELDTAQRAPYHHIDADQSMHVLPLADGVHVRPAPAPGEPPTLAGLLTAVVG